MLRRPVRRLRKPYDAVRAYKARAHFYFGVSPFSGSLLGAGTVFACSGLSARRVFYSEDSAAPDARTSFGVTGIRTESLPLTASVSGNGISGPETQKRPADCNSAVSENEPSYRSLEPPTRPLWANLTGCAPLRAERTQTPCQACSSVERGLRRDQVRTSEGRAREPVHLSTVPPADFGLDFPVSKSVHAAQRGWSRSPCRTGSTARGGRFESFQPANRGSLVSDD